MARASTFAGCVCFLLLFFSQCASAIEVDELKEKLEANEDIMLIDIRSTAQYKNSHINSSINIPALILRKKRIPFTGEVVIYGDGVNLREAQKVSDYLSGRSGLSVSVLTGGYAAWSASESQIFSEKGVSSSQYLYLDYQRLVDLHELEPLPIIVDLRLLDIKENLNNHFSLIDVLSVNADSHDYLGDIVAKVPKSNERLLVLIGDDPAFVNQVVSRLHASGVKLLAVLVGGEHSLKARGNTHTAIGSSKK